MTRWLLHGRYVVSDPLLLPAGGLIEDGALLIEDGVVHAVGQWQELRAGEPATPCLGSPATIVVPGFVNAHHHGRGLSAVQLGVPDDVLERWIIDFWAMKPLDPY